jgi:hypothetical protein
MGQMRFTVPRPERIPPHAVERAYLAGIEYIPWRTSCRLIEDQITVNRDTDESGNFYIPWQVHGHGQLVLSSGSLMEREAPYHLPVELARGTLNRIRNQLAVWKALGFQPPNEIDELLQGATGHFIRAAIAQHTPESAADEAEQAITKALDVINVMTAAFTQQVFASRHRDSPKLPTVLAANVGSQPVSEPVRKQVHASLNGTVVPFCWREIEKEEGQFDWEALDQQIDWCLKAGMKIWTGPLISLEKAHIPDWLYLFEGDHDNIRSYTLNFVQAAVQRYAGKVHVWQCAGGMNVEGAISLAEEMKLRLTVEVVQAVRENDARTPMVVSFDQPWAELLSRQDLDLSPIHFADSLVRAELGIAGLGLEINFGYWPTGTLRRDLLEVNRLVDFWSGLGLPILILLTMPSSTSEDEQARNTASIQDQFAGNNELTPENQAALAEPLLNFLVCKQAIYGIAWNQLSDRQPHAFANSGLLDANDQAKPVLKTLAEIRRAHLA